MSRVNGVHEAEALEHAQAWLMENVEKFRTGEWVVVSATEHETAWSFAYQSRAFVESGRITDSLAGNGPLVVPKSGAEPWVAWSGRPVDSQIAERRPTH